MTREKLQADGNPYPDGYPRLLGLAGELDRRLKVLEAELVQTRAERDKLNQTVAYLQGFWVPERVQELIAERDAALEDAATWRRVALAAGATDPAIGVDR